MVINLGTMARKQNSTRTERVTSTRAHNEITASILLPKLKTYGVCLCRAKFASTEELFMTYRYPNMHISHPLEGDKIQGFRPNIKNPLLQHSTT